MVSVSEGTMWTKYEFVFGFLCDDSF